jgi:hypothetical protein
LNAPIIKARANAIEAANAFKVNAKSSNDIKERFKTQYQFAQWLAYNKNSMSLETAIEKAKNIDTIDKDLQLIWDNLLYQLIKKESVSVRQICIQLLITNHIIGFLNSISKEEAKNISIEKTLRRVVKAKIVIPYCISFQKNEEGDKNNKTELFGVNRLGIGVFRKVEQEVCCYVPGEVSHIENILAREYKERQTRNLLSTETTTEDTTEIETESQSDTVSTTRNELNSEIANVLASENSYGIGASLGVSSTIGNTTVNADGSFDFSNSNSASESDTQASTYAQDITNTAMDRILQKTSTKRTTKILQEYEENIRHGFDNREGVQHVTGVYRWIDIIYNNKLINYGKRLMVEFLIPEPARFYKMADDDKKKKKKDDEKLVKPTEPKSPESHGIKSALDIKKDTYLNLIKPFNISVQNPDDQTNINKAFGPEDDHGKPANPDGKEQAYNFTVDFNLFGDYTKYEAVTAKSQHNFDYKFNGTTNNGTYFTLKIANQTKRYDADQFKNEPSKDGIQNYTKGEDFTFTPPKKGSLDVSVNIKNVWDFAVNLDIKMQMIFTDWQIYVYDEVVKAYDVQMDQYNKDLTAYNKALDEQNSQKDEKANESDAPLSTDACRSIEQKEIERIAIEMLTKPFGIEQGKDFYDKTDCNVPTVRANKNWEIYASNVKFFEQVFEWKLMTYLFYPYYWADKCDWATLSTTKGNGDVIFEGFLQSGMARVVIPVRQGFEQAINYYFETGDIWNGGGLVLDSDDELYLSIDEEMQEIEGFVEEEWETRMPTTLTIVQGNSVYLEDEGLPCCNKIEESKADTLLRGSKTILGLQASDK